MSSFIVEQIAKSLKDKQNSPVISYLDQRISGKNFWSMILKSADLLKEQKHYNKTAVSLSTSPEALAIFLAGLIVSEDTGYFDPLWPTQVTQEIKKQFGANILIDQNWPNLDMISSAPLIISPASNIPNKKATPKFTCFTSGSTGTPKGCRRSEQSWIHSFSADKEFTKISPDDWVVVPGSFSHSLFLYAAVRGLFSGASIVLCPRFNPKKIIQFIENVDSSIIFGVPTQLEMISEATQNQCHNVKNILTTGAKLPMRIFNKLNCSFPDASIIEFYGTTELSYVAARKVHADDPPTLVGTPLNGVDITIQDRDGFKVNQKTSGMVYVNSNMAFDGYVTKQGFRPSLKILTVGDSGYVDDAGSLHLLGRIDRVFQSSGRKIIPENIENALLNFNSVSMVAVMPVEDEIRENKIIAIIQTSQAISRRELVKGLQIVLPNYEVPHDFLLCNEFPKTSSGKANFSAISELIKRGSLEKLK